MFQVDVMNLVIVVAVATLALGLMAAGAAVSYAVLRARLPAATRYENISEKLAIAQAELGEKIKELAEINQQIKERDILAAEVAALEAQRDQLRLELDELEPSRKEIENVKEEAAKAAADLNEAQQELEDTKQKLEERLEELEKLDAQLNPERLERLKEEKAAIEAEIARVRTELDKLRPNYESALKDIEEARRLETKLAVLEQEIENRKMELEQLTGQTGTAPETPETDIDTIITDLRIEPQCLAAPSQLRDAPRPEETALFEVALHLENSGLKFDRRTLYAFHTALKVNDVAQLTILAGVSGTGKSLLPRRYAEAMGIHFLQISVEPRWDSPQDLLGFYNYVERRYRATELARLLAYMDPWRQIELPENARDTRKEMAIVLLDEMNLARVEYYFSEFLSRLEARPPWTEGLQLAGARDAMIPLDIRGLSKETKPPRLFPAHNVLFVGTMNDDESTQSLSDKVLDRSNVLQFPAPSDFEPAQEQALEPVEDAQRFDEWRSWVKPASALESAQQSKVTDVIKKLAAIMEDFGRPFGHRLAQAITAYCTNYPANGHGPIDVRLPLSDQIEFRIMPKLRGVEIDAHMQEFDRLQELLKDDLQDTAFSERLGATRELQAGGTGLFVWRGLERGGGA